MTKEFINGSWYLVWRDGDGDIIRQQLADDIPSAQTPDADRAGQLLAALRQKVFADGQTMTALERDRVLVVCLALLRRIAL